MKCLKWHENNLDLLNQHLNQPRLLFQELVTFLSATLLLIKVKINLAWNFFANHQLYFLNSFMGYLRQTLVFMWSTPYGKSSISFFWFQLFGRFLLVLVKVSFRGSWDNWYIPVYYYWSRFVSFVVKGKFAQPSKSFKIIWRWL